MTSSPIEQRVSRLENDRDGIYDLITDIHQTQRVHGERLGRIEERLDGIEGRLDGIEGRLDGIEGRLDGVEGRLDGVEGRLDGIEGRLDGLTTDMSEVKGQLVVVVTKLDRLLGSAATGADAGT